MVYYNTYSAVQYSGWEWWAYKICLFAHVLPLIHHPISQVPDQDGKGDRYLADFLCHFIKHLLVVFDFS